MSELLLGALVGLVFTGTPPNGKATAVGLERGALCLNAPCAEGLVCVEQILRYRLKAAHDARTFDGVKLYSCEIPCDPEDTATRGSCPGTDVCAPAISHSYYKTTAPFCELSFTNPLRAWTEESRPTLLSRKCSSSEAVSCRELADLLLSGVLGYRDPRLAWKYMVLACQYGDIQACTTSDAGLRDLAPPSDGVRKKH